MRILYLHGFASSPASRKARFFVQKLAERDCLVEALDLAPDFQNLTLTGQLEVIENAVHEEPVTLIGSSMGGYLAALYAAEHRSVKRLILLAPAFDFYHLWLKELGNKQMEEWRKNGTISVFHYGAGREVPLHFGLLEDARQYPPFPDFTQPCLLLQGVKDTVVPYENSARFAATHANVTLVSLDTGHEMTDSLDEIWKISSPFLWEESTKAS